MTEPLLDAEHITLRFGGVTAIDNVSFTVEPGELFAIIGPNGAGKTMRLLRDRRAVHFVLHMWQW